MILEKDKDKCKHLYLFFLKNNFVVLENKVDIQLLFSEYRIT